MNWTADPALPIEDALESLRADAVDELVAAFAELEWAETRALAALEGARAAGLPTSAIVDLTGAGSYDSLRRRSRWLRVRALWRERA